jgi:hypothetical protein
MKKIFSVLFFLVFIVTLSSSVYAAGLTQVNTDGLEGADNNLANELMNKINAAFSLIPSGQYAEAIDELQNDILSKTDGCANGGVPDNNDWLNTCDEQEQVYQSVTDVINYLNSLP